MVCRLTRTLTTPCSLQVPPDLNRYLTVRVPLSSSAQLEASSRGRAMATSKRTWDMVRLLSFNRAGMGAL